MKKFNLKLFLILSGLLFLILGPAFSQTIVINDYKLIENNQLYDTVIIENGGSLRVGTGGMKVGKLLKINPGGKVLGGYIRMLAASLLINDAGYAAVDSLQLSMFGPITIGGSAPTKINKILVGWHDRPLTMNNSITIVDTVIYSVETGNKNCPIITNGYDVVLGAKLKWINAGSNTFIKLSGGKIICLAASGENVLIPVGDTNGQSNLSFVVNNQASDLQDSARIEIKLTSGSAHSNALGLATTDYLTRYFSLDPINIISPDIDAGFYYPDTDIKGNESSMKSAFWNGTFWDYGDYVDSEKNYSFFKGIASTGDLSAGNYLGMDVKPCPAPLNLHDVNKTTATIDLAWDVTEGAQSFELAFKKSEATEWTAIAGIKVNSFTLTDLNDSTLYDIKVKTICDENLHFAPESGYSDTISVRTLDDNGCKAPDGLIASSITDKEATLTWNGILPTPNHYIIEYKDKTSETWNQVDPFPTDTFTILTNLEPLTEYSFRVKTACSETIESLSWSLTSDFTTLNICPKPYSLTAENIGIDSVEFKWLANEGNDAFILNYKLKGTSDWAVVNNLTTNQIIVTGLLEGSVYEWQVGGICIVLRDTIFAVGNDILTLVACGEIPSNPQTITISSSTADITWDSVPGITRYELIYRKVGETGWIEKMGSSFNVAKFINLDPGTNYEWSVRTYCEGSNTRSGYTLPIQFTTLIGVPGGTIGTNPIAGYYDNSEGFPAWTNRIHWTNIIDMSVYSNGLNDFEKFENARDELYLAGGGVLYYPSGIYDFKDAPVNGPNGRGLMLKSGVVIQGEVPTGKPMAIDGELPLQTVFKFNFNEKEEGKFVPGDWNLIGMMPGAGEELKDVDNVGIAWVKLVGATVYFGPQMTWGNTYATAGAWKSSKVKSGWANRKPDGTFPFDPFVGAPVNTALYEGAGDGRFVFGCQMDDATVINNITDEGYGPDGYFMYKFGSRIGIYGSNVFVANNRISKPTRCFKYTQTTSGGSRTLVFDYADVTSIDVNKMYQNITSNKLNPDGGYWEKGVIIMGNWFYNHGRKGMDASGYWTQIRDNHNERDFLQEGDDVYGLGGDWKLTLDGFAEANGAADNESRAYDLAGKALWIDGNSWNNTGSNPGNDGESILCQAHGGTQVHSWAVTRNTYAASYNESKKGYLSGYDVSNYGMLVAWNNTKGTVGNVNAKNGKDLIDCAFIPGNPNEKILISGVYAQADTITACPSGNNNPPLNVNANVVEDSAFIRIDWKDASDQEIGFRIDRREVSKTSWTTIAYRPRKSVGHIDNEQKWIDYMAVPGYDYEYRVVAANCVDDAQAASAIAGPATIRIKVDNPYFSVANGTYNESKTIEIYSVTEDAQIYYTTDGSEPDLSSVLYSGPFIQNNTSLIKAKAFKGNNFPSETTFLDLTIITNVNVSREISFSIFPNPANSEITVAMPATSTGRFDLQIFDLSGRKILEQKTLQGAMNTIGIKAIENGVYYVKVITDDGSTSTKTLVIQR